MRHRSQSGSRRDVSKGPASLSRGKSPPKIKTTVVETDSFNVKDYLKPGLKERDIYIYKEIFDMMQSQMVGAIVPNDIRSVLNTIGINVTRSDLFKIVCDYDTEELGYLTFEHFIKIATDQDRPCDTDTDRDYMRVFVKLAGRKQYLDAQDIEKLFMNHGVEFSKELIEDLFSDPEVVENSDSIPAEERKITFDVFRRIMVDFIYKKKQSVPVRIQPNFSTPQKSQSRSRRPSQSGDT